MKQKSETRRIEVGGEGIGEVDDDMIEDRARKLATADGRDTVTDEDRDEAREDLAGRGVTVDPGDLLTEAERPGDGSPPASTGHRAARLELDDEENLAAQEVEEGIEEANLDSSGQRRDE
jgi:hypothetical protein